MATITKFTDLEIWQLGNNLQNRIFTEIKNEHLSKDFALKDQMNRSLHS